MKHRFDMRGGGGGGGGGGGTTNPQFQACRPYYITSCKIYI